jgi:CheY-like chemotaxis protein
MTQCLIIASDADDRRHLTRLLAWYGFELAIVEDAEQAECLCRLHMPDIIVMPQDMDGVDSFDFIQHLQRLPYRTTPKILVYADRADAGAIGRVIWGGASECFVKPFDGSIIDLKLRQAGVV